MEEVKEQPQVEGTQPPPRKRGRPKSTKSAEERLEERRLRHREAQRRSYKKLMGTEKNKKKRQERQKKELVRLKKILSLKAMRLLRQQVEREENPALK
jgi:hypothetical protein